ncbi:hypothetical protein [Salinirubrum litoreum]|uniref:Oligopeptide transporter, OPT family n=1 Tax=Salinirubrum litoreum TaxID=1126234 RepID=A0ABD5R7L4_9EURY|nr:hypothetical protein [Salinirubrum litoreum]
MASETPDEQTTTLADAARLGLDAGLAVGCLGVVGFGLQLHAGVDFGPATGWIALAGVLLGTVLVSAVAVRRSRPAVHRSESAMVVDADHPNPVLAWVAGLGPAVAGAWTLLVLAPTVEWLYPPPRWVTPTVLALPTAVLCGTIGDVLARSSRGLSLDAYEDSTLAVPVLSMLVAVVLFGVSLPDGLWLDTALSGDLLGTTLPFCGALLAGGVGTVTAGRQVVRVSDADWRTTVAVGLRRVLAGTVAVVYCLVVLAVAVLVSLPGFGIVAPGVSMFDLGPAVYGPALVVVSAVGVQLLGVALAPAPWLWIRLRRLLGESVEQPSLSATGETTRSLVTAAVGGLAGFAFGAFGLFWLATALGAPGRVAGAESILVVTGSICLGALGGRWLAGWARAQSDW